MGESRKIRDPATDTGGWSSGENGAPPGFSEHEQEIPVRWRISRGPLEAESRWLLWDIAGQQTFRRLWEAYLRGSKGAIVVARAAAVGAAQHWVALARAHIGHGPLLIMIIEDGSTQGVSATDVEGVEAVRTSLHTPEISESALLAVGEKLVERYVDENPRWPEKEADEGALQTAVKTPRRRLRKRG